MKRIFSLMLMALSLSLSNVSTVQASNPDKCYWVGIGGVHLETTLPVPPVIELKLAGIGKVMASSRQSAAPSQLISGSIKCPNPPITRITQAYDLKFDGPLQLEDGYSDVYKTGVKGVGLRLTSSQQAIPRELTSNNGNVTSIIFDSIITYEFVRTHFIVGTGRINLNFKITLRVNGWLAGTLNANNITVLENKGYFDGCAGVRKDIKVPMGKVWAGEIRANSAPTKSFTLDVRCTGLPAGSKLPVKTYFEGDSPGTGRLNILEGGASGVEISLLAGQGTGIKLPFSRGQAIDMTWQRSDAEGEIYTLPINARYVQKDSLKVEPGKADAVLNYIIEYN